MAWATQKQFAILTGSDEGKDIIKDLPRMEQDDFQKKFNEMLKRGGEGKKPSASESQSGDKKGKGNEEAEFLIAVNDYCSRSDDIEGIAEDKNVSKAAAAFRKVTDINGLAGALRSSNEFEKLCADSYARRMGGDGLK